MSGFGPPKGCVGKTLCEQCLLREGLSPLPQLHSKPWGCEYFLCIAKPVCFFVLPFPCVFLLLFPQVLTAARPTLGGDSREPRSRGELWLPLAAAASSACCWHQPSALLAAVLGVFWHTQKSLSTVSSPVPQLEYLLTWLFGAIAKTGHFSTSCGSHSGCCRRQWLMAQSLSLQTSTSFQPLAVWGVLPS